MEGRQQWPGTDARAQREEAGVLGRAPEPRCQLKLGKKDVYIEGVRTGCQSLSEVRSVFKLGA